jgi:hypothetical protein
MTAQVKIVRVEGKGPVIPKEATQIERLQVLTGKIGQK